MTIAIQLTANRVRFVMALMLVHMFGANSFGQASNSLVDDLFSRLIDSRDSIKSIDVRARWHRTPESPKEDFKTEQILRFDEFGRQYLSELCPSQLVDPNDFSIGSLFEDTRKGFFYAHAYDGYVTSQLLVRSDGRHLGIFDGDIESELTKKTRTPLSQTTGIAIQALSQQATNNNVPVTELDGSLEKVAYHDERGTVILELEFDAEQGSMPTRIRIKDQESSGVFTAHYEEMNGVWFPMRGKRVLRDGKGEVTRTSSFRVEDISINSSLSDEEFELSIPDDVLVNDARFGCIWTHHVVDAEGLGAPTPSTPLSVSNPSTSFSVAGWALGGFVVAVLFRFVLQMRSAGITRHVPSVERAGTGPSVA